MATAFVFTFVGADQPGLVETLAHTVAGHGGNWLESRMGALRLSILGNDRPGIVREVSHALAQRQISVREMDTSITSAPMSGAPLFEAVAHIQVPHALDLAEQRAQLDRIADALTVDIALEDALR